MYLKKEEKKENGKNEKPWRKQRMKKKNKGKTKINNKTVTTDKKKHKKTYAKAATVLGWAHLPHTKGEAISISP